MITRTYSCDLCRDTKPIDELIGLYWSDCRPGGIRRPASKGWERRPARDVERHICGVCAENIAAMIHPAASQEPQL